MIWITVMCSVLVRTFSQRYWLGYNMVHCFDWDNIYWACSEMTRYKLRVKNIPWASWHMRRILVQFLFIICDSINHPVLPSLLRVVLRCSTESLSTPSPKTSPTVPSPSQICSDTPRTTCSSLPSLPLTHLSCVGTRWCLCCRRGGVCWSPWIPCLLTSVV